MQRRPLNISAALALAIERQVDDILAKARAACALQPCAHSAGDSWEIDNALRPSAGAATTVPLVVEPALARPMHFWKRLFSKSATRRFGS
jgi:hypothetical protein